MNKTQMRKKCKKQNFEGKIRIKEGCENEIGINIFRRKCGGSFEREIDCSMFKK